MTQSIKAVNSLLTAEESHVEGQGCEVSQTSISSNHFTQASPLTPPNEPLSNFLGGTAMSAAEIV